MIWSNVEPKDPKVLAARDYKRKVRRPVRQPKRRLRKVRHQPQFVHWSEKHVY